MHTDLTIIEHNDGIPYNTWLSLWNERIQNIFLPNVKNTDEFKGCIQDIDNLQITYTNENKLFRLINSAFLKQILDQEQNNNKILREKIINNFMLKTKSEIKDFKPNSINIAVHIRKFLKTDPVPLDFNEYNWRKWYEKGNTTDIFFQTIIKNLVSILPNAFVHIYSQGEKEIFNHFFDISPNISIYTNNSIMHDLIHLSHADILVMSKGSYSRLANFYSSGVKIIREKSWPTLTDKSLHISSSGNLTDEQKSFILNEL
jgi:hypothetical protein